MPLYKTFYSNMSMNVADLNQPLMDSLGNPRSVSNNQISGEYRSRTDDLLRARQAL